MRIKAFFIMILALLAAQFGAAQGDIVVYEGAITTHKLTNHPGNTYVWGMYKDFSPDVEADPLDYDFIGPPDTSEIQVKWKSVGLFYLKITETDLNSCSNVKVLPVQVLPLSNTIGFKEITSSTCSSLNQNGFNLSINVLDDAGLPLSEGMYPINVNIMLSEGMYSQIVNFSDQYLHIKDDWVKIDPGITNNFEVQITGAKDVNDNPIVPLSGRDLHSRTFFATPKINFVSDSVKVTRGLSYIHQTELITGEPNGAEYFWMVMPPEGTSTDLSPIKGGSAEILWDGTIGTYLVQTFVRDGNGCFSDTITQYIEILNPGELVFNSLYPGTTTCSDLEDGIEGSVPEQNGSLFKISMEGQANLLSAKITIKNPDGKYIGLDGAELTDQQNPEVEIINPDIGKDITFVVIDNWENRTNEMVEFEIQLINGITSDQLEIQAVDGTDINRTITVLSKPVIEFN